MKSIGKCLSEKYVLNGIIESHFSDAYAYICLLYTSPSPRDV